MAEHIRYTMLRKEGEFEIRQYPRLVVALTTDNEDNSAFTLLFNYISGNNKSKEKVKMTSPVISKANYMAFILPQEYTLETAPIPTNPQVTLEEISEKILAVIRFNGITNKQNMQTYSQLLIKRLKEEKVSFYDSIMLFRYNSPFMPGFLRRNELALELKNYKN